MLSVAVCQNNSEKKSKQKPDFFVDYFNMYSHVQKKRRGMAELPNPGTP